MPLILTYVLAAVGAGCLFSTHGFAWLAPALLISWFAFATRAVRAAAWLILGFSGLLAFWSGWALRLALKPEGVGIIILGLTPYFQLFALVAVLLPLLLSTCSRRRVPRPNHALQRTEAGHRASSDHHA